MRPGTGEERPSDLPGGPPRGYPGPAGERGEYPYQQPPQEMQPAPVYPYPPGEFDPRNPPDHRIVGWAHDDSVRPGHIYRYRVVYKIRSPLWNRPSALKDPKLADQYALSSNPAEWSKEIEVASLTNFFVLQSQDGGRARVAVFRWQNGQVHQKEFDVMPGDVIGGPDSAAGVDFTTGWTMVDSVKDLRTDDTYVILLNPDGQLTRRSARVDKSSPEYQRAQQQVASANGAGPGI
jgi:hypothetical protein